MLDYPFMANLPINNLILLHPADNVAVAACSIDRNTLQRIAGGELHAREAVPQGHKIALRMIARGDAVMKFGQVIGFATRS